MRSVISRLTSSGCEVRQNESMARHTTFKTGGAADVLCICRSAKSARDAFFYLSENRLPFEVIGGGSNILVSDKGYRGVILKFYGDDFFEDCGEGYFYVSGGAGACKILTRIMAKGYGGAEFAATIPGGIGGHIAMNAGCYGGEMKDITAWVDAAFEDGIKTLNAGSCAFGHRDSIFLKKQCIILGAMLKLKKEDAAASEQKFKRLLLTRKKAHPDKPSAGSVFKRQGESAEIMPAKLIDEAGLKGLTVGGAQVSQKHGGFIINRGGATSSDIYRLIRKVKEIIYRKYNLILSEEIKFLGDF